MRRTHRLHRREAAEGASLIDEVRAAARPLRRPGDLDPLIEHIGDARYVLLGEASHGTAEYYTWRTMLSQRLIREKNFSFIAVEGDWPDCYRVNRCVKGLASPDESPRDALHAFQRWPTWMWANEEIVALTEWLRGHNEGLPEQKKVGFYGLDVYSLWDSLYAVMSFLQRVDAFALPAAWRAFRCFEPYGEDVQEYAQAARFVPNACEDEVVALLTRLRETAPAYAADDPEAFFQAEQNALVLQNAEAYYRSMVRGGPESWNIRDRHMTETLERLMARHGPEARAIVWEHNTHIGDARFTDMADEDMVNVGQLVRQTHGGEGIVLVGFGAHHGSVIAGRRWEAPMDLMPVPPARPGSWEHILHQAGVENALFLLADAPVSRDWLQPRGHRAIGVVYHPEYEHYGNYVPTVLPRRYDAFLFFDETQALHPLHLPVLKGGEVPETFPSGV
jgi:erythromycin esterase-like protein